MVVVKTFFPAVMLAKAKLPTACWSSVGRTLALEEGLQVTGNPSLSSPDQENVLGRHGCVFVDLGFVYMRGVEVIRVENECR